MANLVQVEGNALLAASSGQATYLNPTTPIKVALMTANGSATAAGTEVVPGANAYVRQTITFAAPSGGSITSSGASGTQTWANMPAVTVVGVEEWDSAGTPVRRWFGALLSSKVTNAGDTFTIAAGSYTKTLG